MFSSAEILVPEKDNIKKIWIRKVNKDGTKGRIFSDTFFGTPECNRFKVPCPNNRKDQKNAHGSEREYGLKVNGDNIVWSNSPPQKNINRVLFPGKL